MCSFQQDKHIIIPLHSTIAPEDQKRAFVRPPAGVRKIVVSTNIAETSVTIEDVVYVVDSGKLKERRFNAARGISMLVLDHVSQVCLATKGLLVSGCWIGESLAPGDNWPIFERFRESLS